MIHTLVTITGDGATHPLSAVSQKASWIQLQAPLANTSDARVGDSFVSATRGAVVSASGFQFIPTNGNANMYDLNSVYYFLASGDKLDVIFNTF